MGKVIGSITKEEKVEIEELYKRREALEILIDVLKKKDIDKNSIIYTKLISDYEDTQKKFNNWWIQMRKKHNWDLKNCDKLNIDFQTNTIYKISN